MQPLSKLYSIRTITAAALALLGIAANAQTPPARLEPGQAPPRGFFAGGLPNGVRTDAHGPKPATLQQLQKLPDFTSGVWAREEGIEHPDSRKILPFLTPAAAAIWKPKIEAHDFRVPWSFCDPAALPALMTDVPRPFEVLYTADRVTMIWSDGEVRRIYTDGTGHLSEDAAFPSYQGDSVGHWEGQTLVVETTHLYADNDIVMGVPAGDDDMRVTERFHLVGKDRLQDDIEVTGPSMLAKPYRVRQVYKRFPTAREVESLCVASKNRNTGSSVDLTPPP